MEKREGIDTEKREDKSSRHHVSVPVDAPSETDRIVDAWWIDHFPGSALARYEPGWNHTFNAVQDLKRRLNKV